MNVSERMADTFGHEPGCHIDGCPGLGRCTAADRMYLMGGPSVDTFVECGIQRCTCITAAITAVVTMEVQTLGEKVLAFHRPSTNHNPRFNAYCEGCWEEGGEDGAPNWPCKTAQMVQDWS